MVMLSTHQCCVDSTATPISPGFLLNMTVYDNGADQQASVEFSFKPGYTFINGGAPLLAGTSQAASCSKSMINGSTVFSCADKQLSFFVQPPPAQILPNATVVVAGLACNYTNCAAVKSSIPLGTSTLSNPNSGMWNLGPIGTHPIWLVLVILIILVLAFVSFFVLLWRRRRMFARDREETADEVKRRKRISFWSTSATTATNSNKKQPPTTPTSTSTNLPLFIDVNPLQSIQVLDSNSISTKAYPLVSLHSPKLTSYLDSSSSSPSSSSNVTHTNRSLKSKKSSSSLKSSRPSTNTISREESGVCREPSTKSSKGGSDRRRRPSSKKSSSSGGGVNGGGSRSTSQKDGNGKSRSSRSETSQTHHPKPVVTLVDSDEEIPLAHLV